MLTLAAVIFYCPDLHCTKFHFTASAVDFAESTCMQCFALYGTDCTTLLEFKAIVILPIKVQCSIELFLYCINAVTQYYCIALDCTAPTYT